MPLSRPLKIMVGAAALAVASLASAQTRPVAEVMLELTTLRAPQFDQARRDDRAYIDQYYAERTEYMKARAALAKELFDAEPTHPEAQKLMLERWATLTQQEQYDEVLTETQAIADSDSPIATDAAFAYANTYCEKSGWDLARCGEVLDAFIARAPGDERGARLLYGAAQRVDDTETQLALYRRMVSEFPDSRATKYAPGKIKQLESIGTPFELTFQNAADGATIDLASQKGTIFVIDFWATWCGPCIAEMPHMKELYAAYHGKGVEFIGVSLDQPEAQGGLEKLIAYVKDNEIPWPQYYQGAGWDSEFSTAWGINSIPALFVVDHEGNLYSTSARGKLEEVLPALIAQRDADR